MKVRAVKRGFFGGLYRKPSDDPKDYFDCPKEAFSSNWMEKVTQDIKPLKKENYIPLESPSLVETGNKREAAKKAEKEKKDGAWSSILKLKK